MLDILLEIDKVCKDNGLTYYLAGGTLLGAVRHKGFIPWDDDIDIAMPREDYERLLSQWSNFSSRKEYQVVEFGNKNYYFPFAKIQDTRTCLIQSGLVRKIDIGLFVDIFPIDNYGTNKDDALNTLRYVSKKCERVKIASFPYTKGTFKWFIKQTLYKAYYYSIGLKRSYEEALTHLQKYDGIKPLFIASTFGMREERELIVSSTFEKTIDVDFEGHKLKAPIGYHEYLSQMYGDYMQLPPEDQRKPPHINNAFWKD